VGPSLALVALFLFLSIAIAIPAELIGLATKVRIDPHLSLLMQQALAWPLTLWIGLSWSRMSFKEACPMGPFPVQIVPALVVLGIGLMLVGVTLASLIPMPDFVKEAFKKLAAASNPLLGALPIVIVAPFAEELFFRGYLLKGYRRFGTGVAIWVTAILFAVVHLNPWQGLLAVIVGVVNAVIVLRTGSLWPAILVHVVVNGSSSFLMGPIGGLFGYTKEALIEMDFVPLPMVVTGAVLTLVGGLILGMQLPKKDDPRRAPELAET